jgi:hypothetical protein
MNDRALNDFSLVLCIVINTIDVNVHLQPILPVDLVNALVNGIREPLKCGAWQPRSRAPSIGSNCHPLDHLTGLRPVKPEGTPPPSPYSWRN